MHGVLMHILIMMDVNCYKKMWLAYAIYVYVMYAWFYKNIVSFSYIKNKLIISKDLASNLIALQGYLVSFLGGFWPNSQ